MAILEIACDQVHIQNTYPVIDDSETEAAAVLSVQLKDVLLLANDTLALTANVVQISLSEPNPTTAKLICTKLARRIVHDLRAMVLIANHGYPSQALTLAASTYEHCFSIAYIGNDDLLAQKWIGHTSPVKPFVNAVELTTIGLANVGIVDEEAPSFIFKLYTQFCMAKHGNPLYEAETGFEASQNVVTLFIGPDTSETGSRESHFALLKIVLIAALSLASYIDHHAPLDNRQQMDKFLRDIELRQRNLDLAAAVRWAGNDPYPESVPATTQLNLVIARAKIE